jgi:hypothetical protein
MKIINVMSSYLPNLGYPEDYLPQYKKKLGYEVEIITSNRDVFIPHFEESVKLVKYQFSIETTIKEVENLYDTIKGR